MNTYMNSYSRRPALDPRYYRRQAGVETVVYEEPVPEVTP